MSDVMPYRTERERDELSVVMIAAFGVVGLLVRALTGDIVVPAFAALAAGYVALLVSDQLALRAGAELVTKAEDARREAAERATRHLGWYSLQNAFTTGSAIILLNLMSMQERQFRLLPWIVMGSLLFGAAWGLALALIARWQVRRSS